MSYIGMRIKKIEKWAIKTQLTNSLDNCNLMGNTYFTTNIFLSEV